MSSDVAPLMVTSEAKIIKKATEDVFEVTGKNPLLDIATELERIALEDDYFISRKLYPNVDFYSGLIYEAMGLPVSMFPVMFAIGRTSGWIAQSLLGQLAAELAREARARAEVLQAPDHAQLADELLGVVEHGRAGQGQAQAVGHDRLGQAAHRLGALGLRVLAQVRLVDDERARAHAAERLAVGGHHLVVEDGDLGGRRNGHP